MSYIRKANCSLVLAVVVTTARVEHVRVDGRNVCISQILRELLRLGIAGKKRLHFANRERAENHSQIDAFFRPWT